MIMEEKKNTPQFNTQKNVLQIDLSVLLRDFLRSFGRLWWLTILLAAIVAVGALLYSIKSYQPMYKVETTFTVETYNPTQSGYTFFYDNHTAAQMALTFPYLLDSDLLLERVKADLGVEYLNGTPNAKVIENSNLFTLSVTSRDPQAAYDILQALIKNYPAVAEYVIGKTQLNMIDYPEFPSMPYNSTQHVKFTAIGCLIGFILGMGVVLVYALMRNTVRKETDIIEKLQSNCLGSVPLVIPKGNRKTIDLSIHNSKVGTPFKESFRGLALQTARMMENRKILLITATMPEEGTSTVARNLADALAEQGKSVVLLNGSTQIAERLRSVQTEADYILIDAPACQTLAKVAPLAEHAEAILYVIRQDYSKLPRVMNCFEDLNQFEAKLIGCVLTGVRSGITGYGYGYGYGYGKGYRYGRYGNYGYGDKKGGKYAAEKEGKQ